MVRTILTFFVFACPVVFAQPLPDKVELDCGKGVKLTVVKIKAGKFTMGSPRDEKDRGDEETQHEVTLTKDYWIGVYEVTQEQYEAVTGINPSKFKGPKLPVDTVSWEDANAFCKKLSALTKLEVRLPTEAEWEYACRAGKTAPFGVGDGRGLSSDDANFNGNRPFNSAAKGRFLKRTADVGSYKPNAWGLFDMHGNVLEWCSDRDGSYPASPVTDPSGPAKGEFRVQRGGSWVSAGAGCRSAFRNGDFPHNRSENDGFRVVLSHP